MEESLARLKRLFSEGDYLASAVLVWVAYDSGMVGDLDAFSERLSRPPDKLEGIAESDVGQVFLARLSTYAPGDADERAIRILSNVISRHRLWGFAARSQIT
jgi:hypothetical protein